VRVTRGKATTDAPVDVRASSSAVLSGQAKSMTRAGAKLPAAGATVVN